MTQKPSSAFPGAKLSSGHSVDVRTFRALCFTGFEETEVVTRQVSELPAGHVRLRVIATGICGSDIHGISGHNGRREFGQIMGHESAVTVIEVADDVDASLLGRVGALNPVVPCRNCRLCDVGNEHVCEDLWVIGVRPDVDATFAENAVVPATNFVPLEGLNDEVLGALVEPLAVGFHSASQAQVKDGDYVLVIGGGPIGQAAALGARARGAENVAVIEPNAHRAALLSKLGFLAADPNLADEQIVALLGGLPHAVIDAVGSSQTVARGLKMSHVKGSVVIVGMADPEITIPAYALTTRERSIVGSYCYSPNSFHTAAEWLANNEEIAAHLIDARISLHEAPQVIKELIGGAGEISKAVIVFDEV